MSDRWFHSDTPVMLQSLSTLSPPLRFGHPPDSRRIISPNFLKCLDSHPALDANSGNQLMSPCLKTTGFTGFSTRSAGGIENLTSGANATNFGAGLSSMSCAHATDVKLAVYIANIKSIALRIKRLSFGWWIGLGSLVPVYVKYSYTSSIANTSPKMQTSGNSLPVKGFLSSVGVEPL